MKKLFLYVLVICIVGVNCGGEEHTRLNLVFGEQPEGGRDVTEIRCYVVGRLEGGDTPIQATLQAWWADEIGVDDTLYAYDTWTFRYDDVFEELRIILQAPPGFVYIGHFWFSCYWTDEDGTYNEIFSDTAYCYQ